MELRTFYAEDMSHGIRTVKQALGPDAVIIESNRLDDRLEIIAAVDFDEALYLKEIGKRLPREGKSFVNDYSTNTRRPMRQAREQSHALLDKLRVFGFSSDIRARLLKTLVSRHADASWREVLGLVVRAVNYGVDDIVTRGGIIALVGATGVGKTTTTAKLAAQFAYRNGHSAVALIGTDIHRIGGHDQLASFGRALGFPVAHAGTKEELQARLGEFAGYDLVLVDTAGVSQRDLNLAAQLKSLPVAANNIKPYLVLSATSEHRVNQEVVEAFGELGLNGAIVTKLDEATSPGSVLSTLIRYGLNLIYTCNGQGVPQDIAAATAATLMQDIKEIIEHTRHRQRHRARLARAGAIQRENDNE